jgi:N-formylmaleamate deformylase
MPLRSCCALALAFTLGLSLSCNRAPKPTASEAAVDAGILPAPFSVRVVGKGPPVLLIPGLASPGSVWDATVAHYQDRYTLHVFTLAGFGGQPPRPGLTLEAIRADVLGYIAQQGLSKPIIIGHSLGGFLAYWLGATAPGNVGPLVAVDGLPFLPALFDPKATAASVRSEALQFGARFRNMTHAQFVEGLRKGITIQATGAENQAQVVAWCAPSDPTAVGNAMAELLTTDLRPLLKDIRVPVLLLAAVGGIPADSQPAARSVYEDEVSSIPDHQVVFMDARHFIMLDDPKGFFAALDAFLAGTRH